MLLIIGSLLAVGCQSELETGYKPKKLGVTEEERRAYYAAPFSPESAAATEGNVNAVKARGPPHKLAYALFGRRNASIKAQAITAQAVPGSGTVL